MKNAGHFANLRNVPLLPKHYKQELRSTQFDDLKKRIQQYEGSDIISRISKLNEANRNCINDTHRILGHIDACVTFRNKTLQTLRTETIVPNTENFEENDEEMIGAHSGENQENDRHKILSDSKNTNSERKCHKEQEDRQKNKIRSPIEKRKMEAKNMSSTESDESSKNNDQPSEEELAKLMEKYLNKSSEGSSGNSVSEPCFSLIPSCLRSSITDSMEEMTKLQSRGTQTDRMLYIEIMLHL